ncbi:MAG: hypothetical protein WC869_10500 [Phycisphaerae bacterium]|jgi:hypothetical protein
MEPTWAIVELMGRNVIAGRISEEVIAGVAMLRVDVPACKEQPEYTKFYSGSAVYGITPTDEATALRAVDRLQVAPIAPYIVAPVNDTGSERQLTAPVVPVWQSDDCEQCELLDSGTCPPKNGAGPCPFEYAELEIEDEEED